MKSNSDFFDPIYIGSKATEAAKQKESPIKQFLKEPLPSSATKEYGISKPTRIVLRGRIAKW